MPEGTGTENAGTTAAGGGETATTGSEPAGSQPTSALASLQKVSAAASSAVDPNLATDPAKASAGTTVQPGQPGANAGAQGEDSAWLAIPEPRRNTILENTRTKERERVLAEVGDVAWARDLKRDEVVEAFNFASTIHQNPVKFATQLVGELLAIPEAAEALRQALTPLIGGSAARSADGKFKLPQAKLATEDGKMRAYSEDQVGEILTNFEAHLMERFGSRLAPVEEYQNSLVEREEVMNVIHQSRSEASTLMGEMRALAQWPKGDAKAVREGEKKIASYLAVIPADTKKRIGAVASMYQAFNTYLEKEVYPTLSAKTEQEVRDNLRRKAAAGTGTVQPSTAQPQQGTKKPSNTTELAAHLAKLAGATT